MLFYLRLFQFLALVLVLIGFYTQILSPLFKGTKLFPYFSAKRTKIENEMTDVREEKDIHDLEKKLEDLKKNP